MLTRRRRYCNKKIHILQQKLGSPTAIANNPFLSSPPAAQANTNIVDLFGAADASQQQQAAANKASDDLLGLGNPFADIFGAAAPSQPSSQPVSGNWMGNGEIECFNPNFFSKNNFIFLH